MANKYLLPCECGEKLTVDASESGLTRSCVCGAELEVPTFRGLGKLHRVTEPKAVDEPVWGNRQRGVVIGLVIALVGFGAALYWSFTPKITPYDFYGEDRLPEDPPPGVVLALFDHIKQEGLSADGPENVERYHRVHRKRSWWMILSLGVGCGGLVVIGATLLLTPSRQPSRRPAAVQRPAPAQQGPPSKQPAK